VKPYALVSTHFYVTSHPANQTDLPTVALMGTNGNMGASARQSRFGLEANLPPVAGAVGAKAAGARVEADFYGGYYPGAGNTWFMPIPRLRLASGWLEWESLKVVVGQDWSIFAPLNPDSLRLAVPAFTAAGNAWTRVPQIRLEGGGGGLLAAVAVAAPVDNAGTFADITQTAPPAVTLSRQPYGGAEKSRVPSLQARVAYGMPLLGDKLTGGASGHYGREAVFPGNQYGDKVETVTSWGGSLDLSVPLWMVTLKGEGYIGENLDGYFSGTGHGSTASGVVAPGAGAPAGTLAESVKAKGGFAQLVLKHGKWGAVAGGGVDHLEAPDKDHPFAPGRGGTVVRNMALMGNVTYAFAPKALVGFEYYRLQSKRQAFETVAVSNHYEVAFQLAF
jgi:hypothetical protein